MKYMTKMRQGRERGRERGGEGGGGGGGKVWGVHRVLDHTYPRLSVARATLVFLLNTLSSLIKLTVKFNESMFKLCAKTYLVSFNIFT